MELPSLDRNAPERVEPLVIGDVRYQADWASPTGRLTAVNAKTNAPLWAVDLYRIKLVKDLEADVQDVFVTSLRQESPTSLLVEDEHHRVYRVDLEKRQVTIAVWPVALRVISQRPLKVEVQLSNPLTSKVAFDKPSVGFGGSLSNDLFTVTADGQEVPYAGMMAKRAKPSSFLVLSPHERFSVELELGEAYAVPPGARSVEVQFTHHNHFSKDDFDLRSSVVRFTR